jgi:hypothetical protein
MFLGRYSPKPIIPLVTADKQKDEIGALPGTMNSLKLGLKRGITMGIATGLISPAENGN